jgi:hypothetical protein
MNDINGGVMWDHDNDSGTPDVWRGSTFTTALTPAVNYTLPTTKDELGNNVPVFLINNDGTATPASWKFGIGNLPGVANTAGLLDGDQIAGLFGPELLLKRASFDTTDDDATALYETGFSYTDTYDVPQKLDAKSITSAGTLSGAGTALSPYVTKINGTIQISVTAPEDDGMVQLALEVPVVAIAATDEPMTWFIRGGLNNGAIDAGVTPTYAKPGQIGGAVVLGFGNLSNFPVINLTPGGWQP